MPDEKKQVATDPNIAKLAAEVEKVAKSVTGLNALTSQLAQRSQQQDANMDRILKTLEKTATKVEPSKEAKEFDLSTEDGTLDVGNLQKFIQHAVGEAVKPLVDDIQSTARNVQGQTVKTQWEALVKDKPDAAQWVNEMKELAKENPNLNVRQLYALARESDPTKATRIDEEITKKKEADEKEKSDTDKPKEPKFGGLFPGFGGGSGDSSDDDEVESMDVKEASEKAWEEVMGDMPPGLIGSDGG